MEIDEFAADLCHVHPPGGVLRCGSFGVEEHLVAGTSKAEEGEVLEHHDLASGLDVAGAVAGDGEHAFPIKVFDGMVHRQLLLEIGIVVPGFADSDDAQENEDEGDGGAEPELQLAGEGQTLASAHHNEEGEGEDDGVVRQAVLCEDVLAETQRGESGHIGEGALGHLEEALVVHLRNGGNEEESENRLSYRPAYSGGRGDSDCLLAFVPGS